MIRIILLSSILAWSQTGIFFENLCEIALVPVSAGNRDLQDRIISIGEKALRLLNPNSVQMLFEGHTRYQLEQHREIGGVDVKLLRNFCKRDFL